MSDLLQSVRIAKIDSAFVEIGAGAGARLTANRNAFLHLVLDGKVLIDDGSGVEPAVHLGPGDYVAYVGTRPQRILTSKNAKETTSNYFNTIHQHDAPPTIRFGSGRSSARLLSGAFHLPVVNPLVRSLPHRMVVRRDKAEERGMLTFDLAGLSRSATGPGSTTLLTSTFDFLFMQAVRTEMSELFKNGLQFSGNADNFRISIALSLIHSHTERRWTLEMLAREVGIARSTFAAEFLAVVGEPMMQYVTRLRMARAADMLRWQPVGVTDVAWNVGYESVASFTRAFRKHFQTTPAAYQRAQVSRYAETISGHMHWTPFLGDES